MAIENYVCEHCDHTMVCEIKKKIAVFSEEAKTQLGVDIKVKSCENYDEARV